MAKRIRENDEIAESVARQIRKLGERVGREGDVESIPLLLELEQAVADALDSAMAGLRHEPWSYSWAQIGDRIGMTRQGVQRRWGHVGGDRKAGAQPAHLR
jgi:hypothetical protein